MGTGASIYSEQLYLDIDTSGLSSDESMEGMDSDTNDTFLTNDSMDSDLFFIRGCFGHFYKVIYIFYLRMFCSLLPEDVLLAFTKAIYKSVRLV